MQKLSIGISPCPNDTFMFDALVHKKLAHNFDFDITMGDIEELNNMAFDAKLDITKLSYHALTQLTDEYQILNSGSALGSNCGPLLLSNGPFDMSQINNAKIAIPGKHTTANMLLHLAFPNIKNTVETLFSEIEDQLCNDNVDLGLVIHENRFTYHKKGLTKIMDLGEFWESKTQLPIPLGAIVIKRSLPEKVKKEIDTLLNKSIQYAFDQPQSAKSYIQSHAQTMEENVVYQHISLYVNEYSLDLGPVGKSSVRKLFKLMLESKKIDRIPDQLFV